MKENMYLNKSLFIQSRQQNILNYYQFIPKELGRGAYGVVYKAKQRKAANSWRAIKKLSRKMIKNPEVIVNEVQSLKKLDHPNIIRLYETFQDQNSIYIITDLCQGGELFQYLDSKGNFSEYDARELFIQIIDAINHCHRHKISHRDLKPQNFLFLNKQSMNIKLIDFGLSFRWNQDMATQVKQKKQNKLVGTSYYIAPQVIKGGYDQRCDIWSAGVILYILVTALPPFDGNNDKQIIQSVKKLQYTFDIPEMKNISSELKDLIAKILVPQNERISIEQIYKHPWMTSKISNQPLKINFANMTNFSKCSKLKKITASYIASQLSQKQIEKLGILFKQIDVNHDGYISIQQLKAALVMQELAPSLNQLKALMDSIDTDKNGMINYTEFIASSLDNSILNSQEHLASVFLMLDKDGNGVVQRSQLIQALQKNGMNSLNGKDVDQIISSCDVNGDGMIDFHQFVASVRKG